MTPPQTYRHSGRHQCSKGIWNLFIASPKALLLDSVSLVLLWVPLNSQTSAHFCLLSVRIRGMCTTPGLQDLIEIC